MRINDCVDGLAERIRSLLKRREGKEQIERLNQLVARVESKIPTLRGRRKKLRRRAGVQLYINASSAQNATDRRGVRMSVRVHGCECGTVKVDSDKKRTFAPSNRRLFEHCDYDKVRGLEWEDSAVARFIKACVDAIDSNEVRTARPEASVESDLIFRMKSGRVGPWRFQQPVCLAGMPLQVLMPITASRSEPMLGDGHIDVLARLGRGGKGLRVYEVKAPGARVENALNQAVAYSVALKFLLTQDDAVARRAWWRLLEFSKQPNHMPRLEAFAYVADNPENRSRLEKACRRLATANRENIVVGAMFY